MAPPKIYQPRYSDSRALIIGIDRYLHVSPLAHARNDAVGIAEALTTRFGFKREKIDLLTDQEATRAAILGYFMRFSDIEDDTRILVFFAGHGHTVTGHRGETGFLVPVDGRADDLSTLIRWDELTRNADLIPAKHLLFIMDACYGGLALSRKPLPPGSMRFVRDMLQRFSRQVLTAGKADEVVADAGGPRAGHSIFTGHVLDGMEGAAATKEGVISGNGLMAYVHERVGSDPNSRQTPHYGFVDGDGDFIFNTAPIDNLGGAEETGKDLLVSIPSAFLPGTEASESSPDMLKRLIPDPKDQIVLDDFVTGSLRRTIDALRLERFPVQGIPFNATEFPKRIKQFDDVISETHVILILLARWAEARQLPLLEKVLARLAERDKGGAGTVEWLQAGWYPNLTLMYSGGISALSAGNYPALRSILTVRVRGEEQTGTADEPAVLPIINALTNIVDAFKTIPGHERHYAPRSEYLFNNLQPNLEDLLFLGRTYESLFDRFEILLALTFADIRDELRPGRDLWGPPGRFAWKHHRGYGRSPFDELVAEAEHAGNNWGPVQAGLFGGSIDRFVRNAQGYRELLQHINWW